MEMIVDGAYRAALGVPVGEWFAKADPSGWSQGDPEGEWFVARVRGMDGNSFSVCAVGEAGSVVITVDAESPAPRPCISVRGAAGGSPEGGR